MAEEKEYPGMMHSLFVEKDGRIEGIKLKANYFKDIAYRAIGDYSDSVKVKNLAVSAFSLNTFAKETDMWHVKVGNAILNINPEGVIFYFDVPVPKEGKQ